MKINQKIGNYFLDITDDDIKAHKMLVKKIRQRTYEMLKYEAKKNIRLLNE